MRSILLISLLAGACLGGTPNAGDDAGGGGDGHGNIDDDLAVLQAALSRVNAIVAASPDFTYDTLRAAALSDDRVALAGTGADGALWISVDDGPLAVIAIDPTPAGASAAPHTAAAAARPVTITASTSVEMPARATFRAYDILGGGFTDPTGDISRMLTAKGYASESTGPATVEELHGIKDVGVLFVKTHGQINATGPENKPVYALYTATPYPDDAEEAILKLRDDLFTGRVVVFDAVNKQGWIAGAIPDMHYAITEKFVAQYMSVASHGVVLLEACQSGSNPGAAFGAAFKNAALYVGWDGIANATTADDTMRYLVDRMLGTNDSSTPVESPKQRAFEFGALGSDINAKGLSKTTSDRGTAVLAFTGNAILAPSIKNIDVDEAAKTLTFHGQFGSAGDTVAVGGQSLAIRSWANDTIVTSLPTGGGDAVVTVNGRSSNPVQLTDWNGGTVTYTLTANTTGGVLKQTLTWHPHLRADLHAFRDQPGVAPADRMPVAIINAADSTCHYKNEGADIQAHGSVTWSGEDDVTPFTTMNASGSGCIVNVTVDPRSGMTAVPARAFMHVTGAWAMEIDPPGQTIFADVVPDPIAYADPSTWGLTMTRDAGFGLVAGSGTPGAVSIPGETVQGSAFLTWTAQPASSPPDPDAAR
jgi:hypothetical protein